MKFRRRKQSQMDLWARDLESVTLKDEGAIPPIQMPMTYVGSMPSEPTDGQVYYNTARRRLYYRSGDKWVPVGPAMI